MAAVVQPVIPEATTVVVVVVLMSAPVVMDKHLPLAEVVDFPSSTVLPEDLDI